MTSQINQRLLWRQEHKDYEHRGRECELHDLCAEDMTREELLAIIGFLDELVTDVRTGKQK